MGVIPRDLKKKQGPISHKSAFRHFLLSDDISYINCAKSIKDAKLAEYCAITHAIDEDMEVSKDRLAAIINMYNVSVSVEEQKEGHFTIKFEYTAKEKQKEKKNACI